MNLTTHPTICRIRREKNAEIKTGFISILVVPNRFRSHMFTTRTFHVQLRNVRTFSVKYQRCAQSYGRASKSAVLHQEL